MKVKWAWLILLVMAMDAGMFAKTYTINAYVRNNKIIYVHSDKKTGAHGHQFAVDGDTINWGCEPQQNCDSVTVTFKTTPPCAVSSTACNTITTGNIDLGLYGYSITVNYGGKPYTEDPEVIVDNGTIGVEVDKDKKGKANKSKK